MTRLFSWLSRMERVHPFPTYTGLVLTAALVTLAGGYWMTPAAQLSLKEVLDNAGIIAGLASMVLAWPLVILAWARRQDAKYRHGVSGAQLQALAGQFQASLIIASQHCQPEWHLRHLRPRRAEFLTTAYTLEKTQQLLSDYPDIQTVFDYHSDHPMMLSNAQAETFDQVYRHAQTLLNSLLKDYGREEICVDITAGTTIMSVATYQAAESLGITSLYLRGVHRNPTGLLIIDNNHIHDPQAAEVILVSDHRKPDRITS